MIGARLYKGIILFEILLLAIFASLNVDYTSSTLALIIIVAFLNLSLFLIIHKKNNLEFKNGLASILFLIGYVIVFYQDYLDLLFGYLSKDDVAFASPNVIIKCALISTAGLLAFFFGYLSARYPKINDNNAEVTSLKNSRRVFNWLIIFGLGLFMYYNIQNILFGRYSQEFLEASAGTMVLYSNILFQLATYIILIYNAKLFSQTHSKSLLQFAKTIGLIPNLCIAAYIVLTAISGDRGSIITIMLCYFGSFLYSSEFTLKRNHFVILILCAAIIVSLMGRFRTLDRGTSFSQRMRESSLMVSDGQSVCNATKELAGSVNALHYSVQAVPKQHPYLYFEFPIKGALSAIPFADKLKTWIFRDNHFRYRSSAFFVTWLIQGDNYIYGSGTDCNADLYLSFGIIGVILGLFLWGCIIRRIEFRLSNKASSVPWLIIGLYVFSYTVYVNRASLYCFLNYMVFALIFDYMVRVMLLKEQ